MHHKAFMNQHWSLCVNNDLDIEFDMVIVKFTWNAYIEIWTQTFGLVEKCMYSQLQVYTQYL